MSLRYFTGGVVAVVAAGYGWSLGSSLVWAYGDVPWGLAAFISGVVAFNTAMVASLAYLMLIDIIDRWG